ncbi:hypothetical protein SAMN02745121_03949 [Nannocystis exedens]|uniref:Uncharacterized protein n=1 Tax=Nannocystis exedens TaxID=54 RepID=A0A1I1ZT83_9BACT|nr:hypothetical protein [Nannocystis exedens]PCC75326.1 hypothetical protein NAEX_08436 [Nannocystis exedens]SFE34871.1 hypothetical protein SAMN02745121_03949 [Nannocystis exedens]
MHPERLLAALAVRERLLDRRAEVGQRVAPGHPRLEPGRAGIGTSMFALARRDGLVRVLPRLPPLAVDAWLAMHEGLRTPRRVRLRFDLLAARLGGYVTGEGPTRPAPPRGPAPKAPTARRSK